jgi:hypothetical protein
MLTSDFNVSSTSSIKLPLCCKWQACNTRKLKLPHWVLQATT